MPFMRKRTSTPSSWTSTRSTSSCTIRPCSAGNSSSHSGSSCGQRLARLVLGDVILLRPRRAPRAYDDLRLPEDAAQLVDDRRLDLRRRHARPGRHRAHAEARPWLT